MNKQTRVRLPSHVRPERYKIMLRPDLEGFTFYGGETIYLSLGKPTKQITLHSAELEIDSAEFIHKSQETWAAQISYDPKAETATFTFPKKVQKGKGKLKLIFRGVLNDKMRGFYRSRYEVGGVSKHLATTQFESTDARRAFPCFDEPSQKAIFDVTLMVPMSTTAISNTIETNILEHESGYKVVEFAPTPKMSTYLLAFIVGEFEYIEGKSEKGRVIRVFTTPGKKEQAKFALDVAIKCLDFYEKYFDIPYPLPVLDLIAIPDFAAGAMENWGAVTYRESTLLIDEQYSSSANKQWVALVIAHELAHQWFGNLVTMEWWSDLWLNEGFACFIEYLAIDHIFPEWDIWTQFVSIELGTALKLDALKNTHPIEVEVGHPGEIREIFDKVSYSKGAAVLRMLMSYLGEGNFQKGLQHYLKKHAYSNAKTEDLWLALEEVSGKPVREVMANWTSKPGHPVISVREKGKGKRGKLELTQSRFFSSPISRKETNDQTLWSIPLTSLRAPKGRGNLPRKIASSRTPRNDEVLMDKKTLSIPKPKDNELMKLNTGEVSMARVDYPQEYLKRLEEAIKHGKLSAPDRLGLIRDSFSLAQAGNSPTTLALELTRSYINEEDYTVWNEVTAHIAQLDSLLANESFYEVFKAYGREIYGWIAKKIGWEKKKSEKHTDALLRGMVLNMLGGFGDEETIKKAKELFYSSVIPANAGIQLTKSRSKLDPRRSLPRAATRGGDDNRKIDPDLKSVVYNLVAENGGKKEFETLVKMYKSEDNQQEKDRIGKALALFPDKVLLQKALHFALSKYVRPQNSLSYLVACWTNPKGRDLTWDFVKKNWPLIRDKYSGGYLLSRLIQAASEFTTKEAASDLQVFFEKNPTPEVKRTVEQAVEQIYSNAEWLKRDSKRIEKFLEKFVPETLLRSKKPRGSFRNSR